MAEIIRNLSSKAEFIIVISICFGYSIVYSLIMFISYLFSATSYSAPFTNENLISLVIYEIVILILVTLFLQERENPLDYNNNTRITKLIGVSLLLTIVYYLIYISILLVINIFIPQEKSALDVEMSTGYRLQTFIIFSVSIVNAIFEEIIVVGYVIKTLYTRKSLIFTINVSVLIRFLYHLYQGPAAALSIIPMGLLFAFVYVKWRNIWPLIIAHGIMDLIALYTYGL